MALYEKDGVTREANTPAEHVTMVYNGWKPKKTIATATKGKSEGDK